MATGYNAYIKKKTGSFIVCLCLVLSCIIVFDIESSRYQNASKIMINRTKPSLRLNNLKDKFKLPKELDKDVNRTNNLVELEHKDVNRTNNLVELERKDKNSTETKKKKKIKIVVYFPRQARVSQQIQQLKLNKCEYKNCLLQQIFVEIHGSLVDADAVVLQGNNMPGSIPEREGASQVFVFLNNEPPMYIQYTNLNTKYFHNYFNWTMTFKTDSDIPLLYGQIVRRDENLKMNFNQKIKKKGNKHDINGSGKNYTKIFRTKRKGALWLVSHCFTKSKREKYIDQMRNYTKIDQFGACNKMSVNNMALDSMSEQYKFYLAFENTFCTDYITEKVFKWFATDLVLVVRGGCNYTKFLPNGTYIDANDFSTPVELAKYLTELGENENEYIRILQRKDEYHVVTELEMVQIAFCELCKRLNNVKEHQKSVSDIYSWWQVNSCWKPKDI